MRVAKDTERIQGSYLLKFQIIKEIEKTEDDMTGSPTFIPAVGEAILEQLRSQLELVEERIQEKWDSAEMAGGDVAIQGAFDFYWSCSIDEEEIPF